MKRLLPPIALQLLAVMIGYLVAVAHVHAQAQPGAQSDAAWASLESLAQNCPAVATYRAAFTQNKYSPLLSTPIVSTGWVQMAGGVARWNTNGPHPTVMTLGQGTLRLYYPEQQTVEIYDLGDRLDALAASPVPDLAVLREHFEPEQWGWGGGDAPFEMTLKPTSETMREAVDTVVVTIDPQTGTLARFTLTDLDGETTEMIFTQVELNADLDVESLRLELPAGTRIVHPLHTASP